MNARIDDVIATHSHSHYLCAVTGEEVYLAIVMDVFTHGLRCWYLSCSLAQELPLGALNKALRHARLEIHHSNPSTRNADADTKPIADECIYAKSTTDPNTAANSNKYTSNDTPSGSPTPLDAGSQG